MRPATALTLIITTAGLAHIGLAVISGELVYLVIAALYLLIAAVGIAVAVRTR